MGDDKEKNKPLESKPFEPQNPDQDGHDIKFEVPSLKVGSVNLEVDKLDASISVKAKLSEFINIEIGTNVHLENVKLEVKEVEAETTLTARLNRIESIMLSALETLQHHPELIRIQENIASESGKDTGKAVHKPFITKDDDTSGTHG
jgi:hypothetical protein